MPGVASGSIFCGMAYLQSYVAVGIVFHGADQLLMGGYFLSFDRRYRLFVPICIPLIYFFSGTLVPGILKPIKAPANFFSEQIASHCATDKNQNASKHVVISLLEVVCLDR